MSITPRELLHRLFVYIEEQLKDIDPRVFQIGKSALPRLFPQDLANLPGVYFDVQEEGDHVWMKVARLEEIAPPAPEFEKFGKAIRIDADRNGKLPQLIEVALDTLIRAAQKDVPEAEHIQLAETTPPACPVRQACLREQLLVEKQQDLHGLFAG
jgi:hypothetical protein